MTDPENRPDPKPANIPYRLVTAKKPRISEDDLLEGLVGICSECQTFHSPVEADASEEMCPGCYKYTLYGAEEAVTLGICEVTR